MKKETVSILIADDQTLMRDGLKTILSLERDFVVAGTAANGKEAVEMAEAHQPDVVLLDIRMPEMDGVSAMKHIKGRYPSIKVIMLTTFNDEDYIIEALASGASGYLLKDIEMDKLIEMIRDAAAGKTIMAGDVAAKLAEGLTRLSAQAHTQAQAQASSQACGSVQAHGSEAPQTLRPAPQGIDDALSSPGRQASIPHSSGTAKEFPLFELTEREREIAALIVQGFNNKQISMLLHISEGTVRNYISNLYGKIGVTDRIQALIFLKEHGFG